MLRTSSRSCAVLLLIKMVPADCSWVRCKAKERSCWDLNDLTFGNDELDAQRLGRKDAIERLHVKAADDPQEEARRVSGDQHGLRSDDSSRDVLDQTCESREQVELVCGRNNDGRPRGSL